MEWYNLGDDKIIIDWFYWTVTAFALVGVVLNIYHNKYCFLIWLFTNAAFAIESFIFGVYNMAFLFSIYFVLAILGLWKWHSGDGNEV